jgi:hypothetical protein
MGGEGDVMTDRDREELIDAYRVILATEPERLAKDFAMQRMRELIAERSPQQVKRMEEARGLR